MPTSFTSTYQSVKSFKETRGALKSPSVSTTSIGGALKSPLVDTRALTGWNNT